MIKIYGAMYCLKIYDNETFNALLYGCCGKRWREIRTLGIVSVEKSRKLC